MAGKAAAAEKPASKLDLTTVAGLAVGLGGIIGGLLLEGGSVREIVAPTALMIVLGGTAGAVMVSTPFEVLRGGLKSLAGVFFEKEQAPESMIDQIVDYSTKARKNGIVALEQVADEVADPFLRKALNLAVDGTDLQELRGMMELEIAIEEQHAEAEARIFEGAGGYAPTIGIIGAVLGLIQVMKDLADIEKVGHGIATAFVATIYGVAFANLFFLPASGKIKARAQQKAQMRELILEGVVGIVEGSNPKLIRSKLEAYTRREPPESKNVREIRLIMSSIRRKMPVRENHERWLISYADFITLLFAFFVVMFASSQTDKHKAQQLSDSIKNALGKDKISSAIAGILGGTPGRKVRGNAQRKGPGGGQKALNPETAKIVELTPSLAILRQQLKLEIDTGMLQVSMEPRGLVISLRQAAFFPPGQDTIDAGTYSTIRKLAQVILAVPNKVRLEGHTDAVPIHNARYRSNWELSAARGVTMLELLTTRYDVPESRMSVGGYAETIAIASNDTTEGRAQNRRVDIVILNENGLKGEPESRMDTK